MSRSRGARKYAEDEWPLAEEDKPREPLARPLRLGWWFKLDESRHPDREIQWLHSNIEPLLFALLLVLAAELNEHTAYLFVPTFLLLSASFSIFLFFFVYRRGFLRIAWDFASHYARLFWTYIVALHDLYFVKVAAYVLLCFLVASSSLWCYEHVNIWQLLEATFEFIVNLPTYLMNSKLLIEAIQRLLNRFFLSPIVDVMSFAWHLARDAIIADPMLGMLYILGGLGALIGVFVLGNLLL